MNEPQNEEGSSEDARPIFYRTRLDLSQVRAASWFTLVVAVVVASALTAAIQLNLARILELARPLTESTSGLVHPTLLIHVLLIPLVVGGILLWFGRLRPRDLGLVRRDVPLGAAVLVGTWLLMQTTGVAVLLVQGRPVELPAYWAAVGVLPILGGFIAQLFGNALYEEVVYRAFLMNQVAKQLARRNPGRSPRGVFVLAVLVSQGVFALIHVPGRYVGGAAPATLPAEIVAPFLFGVLFVLVYYRTGNLFVAVGLHALVNAPVVVVDAGPVVALPLFAVIVGIVVAWPYVVPRIDPPGGRDVVNVS